MSKLRLLNAAPDMFKLHLLYAAPIQTYWKKKKLDESIAVFLKTRLKS